MSLSDFLDLHEQRCQTLAKTIERARKFFSSVHLDFPLRIARVSEDNIVEVTWDSPKFEEVLTIKFGPKYTWALYDPFTDKPEFIHCGDEYGGRFAEVLTDLAAQWKRTAQKIREEHSERA